MVNDQDANGGWIRLNLAWVRSLNHVQCTLNGFHWWIGGELSKWEEALKEKKGFLGHQMIGSPIPPRPRVCPWPSLAAAGQAASRTESVRDRERRGRTAERERARELPLHVLFCHHSALIPF